MLNKVCVVFALAAFCTRIHAAYRSRTDAPGQTADAEATWSDAIQCVTRMGMTYHKVCAADVGLAENISAALAQCIRNFVTEASVIGSSCFGRHGIAAALTDPCFQLFNVTREESLRFGLDDAYEPPRYISSIDKYRGCFSHGRWSGLGVLQRDAIACNALCKPATAVQQAATLSCAAGVGVYREREIFERADVCLFRAFGETSPFEQSEENRNDARI